MLLWNTIEFTHMPLGLIPKNLNTVDMVSLVCKKYRVVDPKVLEVRNIQHVVAPPAVRINDAVWDDLAGNNWIRRAARFYKEAGLIK